MSLLKTQAIQTALIGDWTNAISLNQELLKDDPNDIEALNRLAFAYAIVGKVKEAREMYQKVLSNDILNPIALRGLKRLANNSVGSYGEQYEQPVRSNQFNSLFIEETGKTKVVELINVADKKTVSRLRTGEPCHLSIKRLKIFVLNDQKHYMGMLPDNIGNRLIMLLKGGNCYEAYIKSIESNKVSVFVKEIKRCNKFKNQPSFIATEKSVLSFEKGSSAYATMKIKNNDVDEDSDYFSDDSESEDSL